MALVAASLLLGLSGCGSSDNSGTQRERPEATRLGKDVETRATDYAPIELEVSRSNVFVRTAELVNGSNLWMINRRTQRTTRVERAGRITDLVADGRQVWGLEATTLGATRILSIDSVTGQPAYERVLERDCTNRDSWLVDGVFWLRCGRDLVEISGEGDLEVWKNAVSERSLIVQGAGTLWELRSQQFSAVGDVAGAAAVAFLPTQDGPWDSDEHEAGAIAARPSGAPVLKRIRFAQRVVDEFAIDSFGLTPFDITLLPTEVWVTTVERPLVLRYSRENPVTLLSVAAFGNVEGENFDIRVSGDINSTWVILRDGEHFSIIETGR